ncbi:NAD(P)H-binding protein [Endozoicomonas ascidiicola]|uniref:NAD(P)H-binding protein n=1 Tax=Endozoicomonas ascidiicola TaxID=1698521 RepID=UPI00082D3DD6|nr:NAD(P)H-binding protein [Endozoicomonas ascidiicola]
MKETISILGCGWLGMPLGERLVNDGYPVKGSTTRAEKISNIKAAGMAAYNISLSPDPEGDIADFLDTDILFINIPPGKGDGQPHFYLRQMQALAKQIDESRVKKIILISATSVYPQNNDEVTENDAIRIESPFSDTAWLDIEELFTLNEELKTTVLRFSGLIGGDYQPGRYFSGRELGGADDPVNMIHQEDCILIVEEIIAKNLFGEVFNASADEHPTRRELYTRSCEVLGIAAPIFIDKPMPYRIVNCDKLKKALNYQFTYPDPMQGLSG